LADRTGRPVVAVSFLPATIMAIAIGLVVVVGISASMLLRKSAT
jgi:hypothetical protein